MDFCLEYQTRHSKFVLSSGTINVDKATKSCEINGGKLFSMRKYGYPCLKSSAPWINDACSASFDYVCKYGSKLSSDRQNLYRFRMHFIDIFPLLLKSFTLCIYVALQDYLAFHNSPVNVPRAAVNGTRKQNSTLLLINF